MNALRLILILSMGLLAACAPHKPATDLALNEPTATTTAPGEKAKAANLTSWVISGAMAAKNQNKAWSASLNWQQQGLNTYQIRLFGPLGGGTVIIERNGGAVTFKDGPKIVSSNNADELLRKQTGIGLPVHNLYYWVRGLPAPGAVQASQYDKANRLISLKQGGYTIEYTGYTTVNGMDLPTKVRLQGHGVLIKLVVKSWNV